MSFFHFHTVNNRTDICLNPDSQQDKITHVRPVGWAKSILPNDHAGGSSRDASPVHSCER